jgi:hypothetical protein
MGQDREDRETAQAVELTNVTGNERRCAHGRRCGIDCCGVGHARDFPAACGDHCPICEEMVRQTRGESA